ncbi:ribosome silencing factor [Deinococcota bacterium DY0809b]
MVKTIDAVELITKITQALEDKKAEHVVALDLRKVSHSLDYFVIATGTSQPHLQALQDHVQEKLRDEGIRPDAVEGPSSRWWLLSYGPVLVHIMSPEARDYYDLEGFWADAERLEI